MRNRGGQGRVIALVISAPQVHLFENVAGVELRVYSKLAEDFASWSYSTFLVD
jgi:hypothetical protein